MACTCLAVHNSEAREVRVLCFRVRTETNLVTRQGQGNMNLDVCHELAMAVHNSEVQEVSVSYF